MEHRIYRENIRVRHREADRNGRLKLLSWFDFLQEAAANHAARLGVGLNALTERGRLWVLSRLKLEIRRSPRIGEELTVETYPSGVNRLFFTREFQVFDKSGEVIARASSAWLLLSAAKIAAVGIGLRQNHSPLLSETIGGTCFRTLELEPPFCDRRPIFGESSRKFGEFCSPVFCRMAAESALLMGFRCRFVVSGELIFPNYSRERQLMDIVPQKR